MSKDIVNEINKEILIQMLKQWIKANYPPVLADLYCHQLDDAKHFAKLLETMMK